MQARPTTLLARAQAAWRRGGWPLWLGVVTFGLLCLAWLTTQAVAYDPSADTNLSRRFEPAPIGPAFWHAPFGRDLFGRNLALVLLHGVRAFFIPGLESVCLALPLALFLALARPHPHQRLPGERSISLALGALPSVIWLLLASVAFGQEPTAIAVALAVTSLPDLVASLRSRFGHLEALGVLEGALAHGLPAGRIRWTHLARLEGLPLLARRAPRLFVSMLLTEAALSYLGDFGVPEPIPSWGRLLRDLSPLLFSHEPVPPLWVLPLLAILLVTLGMQGLGEGLARALERGAMPAPPPLPLTQVRSNRQWLAPEDAPLLRVEGLSLSGPRQAIFQALSITLHPGQVLAVVGESGVGKTLLLRAILGKLPNGIAQTAGTIGLHPGLADPSPATRSSRPGLEARIGWISQSAAQSFDPLLTIGQHLEQAMTAPPAEMQPSRQGPPDASPPRPTSSIAHWLSLVGLPREVANKPVRCLSGGMARRAATAWVLARGARLVLADEPTAGIDPPGVHELLKELALIRRQGAAILLVTHDLSVALRLADRVAFLHQGRLVEQGPTQAVLESPFHPYVRHLLACAEGLRRGDALGGEESWPVPEPQHPDPATVSDTFGTLTPPPTGCPYRPVCWLPSPEDACQGPLQVAVTGDQHEVLCSLMARARHKPPAQPLPASSPAAEKVDPSLLDEQAGSALPAVSSPLSAEASPSPAPAQDAPVCPAPEGASRLPSEVP